MKETARIYLSNLNAIRAIAALIVIVSHIEKKMSFFDLPVNAGLSKLGPVGVTLFFALSGFLITYLLLIEKEKFQKINIKDFYIRRFLRIWPLYYLLLLFVYLAVPYLLPEYYAEEQDRFTLKSAVLNVFFLTNITMVIKYTPLIISVIWSIGIEEQFYLFWPWLVKSKQWIKKIVGIIVLIPVLKIIVLVLSTKFPFFSLVYDVMNLTRFDSMAIGGLFGVLALNGSFEFLGITVKANWFKGRKLQYFLYPLTIGLLIYLLKFDFLFNIYNFQILPVLFSVILLNMVDNQNSILSLENKFLNYLGKISYSLYLLHLVLFYFIFPLFREMFIALNIDNSFGKVVIIYVLSIVGSILLGALSYELLEKRFLSYKKYFTHVQSGG